MRAPFFMYVTLAPVILTGVLNMAFCKLPVLGRLQKPIDGGRILRDGRRLFGDNKTWKGLFGYVLLGMVSTLLWGGLCAAVPTLEAHSFFYLARRNTPLLNLAIGALLGLAYALFELPNSFLKRRCGITPGKQPTGGRRLFFVLLDQTDSLFGCILVVCLFHPLRLPFYFAYVAAGAVTHLLVNFLLYAAHLRKNML